MSNLETLTHEVNLAHSKLQAFLEDRLLGEHVLLKYGRYKGRKAIVREIWARHLLKCPLLFVGIERYDGRTGYIDNHNASYVGLTSVEIPDHIKL